jgi:hypothetical protein
MVGPFIFFDQMGPGEFLTGEGLDVRPHPHIGLSTITYLFSGSLDHADSLGVHKTILPGDINLMTAGSGIVHSERTGATVREKPSDLFGIQSWIALPKEKEEVESTFTHYARDSIPLIEAGGVSIRVIAGEFGGVASSIMMPSEALYLDVTLQAGASIDVPPHYEERALYALSGEIEIDGVCYPPMQLLLLKRGARVDLRASRAGRVVVIGGEPLEGPRYIWWNFVSSSRERIDQAKRDWREGRFPLISGDSKERIPLPDTI